MNYQSQKKRTLALLRERPRTSREFPMNGILCYTRRISELRQDGHEILTTAETINGIRVFTYTLVKEKEGNDV